MTALRRSPRAGWTLVVLRDGAWRVDLVGDREAVKLVLQKTISPWLGEPALWHPGRAALVYDAHGQLRDSFPWRPRLADSDDRATASRVVVPTSTPQDGARAEVVAP